MLGRAPYTVPRVLASRDWFENTCPADRISYRYREDGLYQTSRRRKEISWLDTPITSGALHCRRNGNDDLLCLSDTPKLLPHKVLVLVVISLNRTLLKQAAPSPQAGNSSEKLLSFCHHPSAFVSPFAASGCCSFASPPAAAVVSVVVLFRLRMPSVR